MCSIANLFDRNIIKFDAKNCIFFLPKILKLCKPLSPAFY